MHMKAGKKKKKRKKEEEEKNWTNWRCLVHVFK